MMRAPEHEVFIKHRKGSSDEEMTVWCTKRFGKRWSAIDHREGTWCCFWAGRERPGHFRWCFTHEQDMVLFLLRWQ